MQNFVLRARASQFVSSVALVFLASIPVLAQRPEARILAPIDNAVRTTLPGSHQAAARADQESGRVPAGRRFEGVTINFSRSPAQQTALDALVAAQQNPASPQYQHWLTPDEFGAQFGASEADLAKVRTWLTDEGFTVGEVARSRDRISFSGTAAQVEAAFGTEIHFFKSNGETHFAPQSDLSVPAAFAGSVLAVSHLSDFRPRAHVRMQPAAVSNPAFTSGQTLNNFVGPQDVATIYDVNRAYNAGWTGVGQTIAVVGQSAIVLADITNFQVASGTPVRAPIQTLVPGTGASYLSSVDQAESDLDVEYTGAIAKGATINFVYTGNNTAYGAFDALQYAVANRLAPIISVSYGTCETALGTSYAQENAVLQQGAAQGQSIIVAAGDAGSTDCYPQKSLTTAQRTALAVDYPGDSQYVTAMGGSEFLASAVSLGNTTYWRPVTGTDVLNSAVSYIPEQVWNDDSAAGLASGGGGVSVYTLRPTWQTGVPGIPSGTYRTVPDISLASSGANAGYLFCSSDTAATNVPGSCSNGFRGSDQKALTVGGGTSFAAPIFAGMLALINQSRGSNGQGVVNPTLYGLASNPTVYASAFHDITAGSNACTAGPTICTAAATTQYPATVGYDQATGLGTIDLYNLLSAWPVTSTLVGSATTVSAQTQTPIAGASDLVSFKVAPVSGSTGTPTGTLTLSVDGLGAPSITLNSGTATYYFSSLTTGPHTLIGVYSGDATFSTSTAAITVTVQAGALKTSAITLVPATFIPVGGAADAITITVGGGTPTPTGSVVVAVDGGINTPLVLVSGAATYSFSSSTLGSHSVGVTYLSDTNYAQSTGTLTLLVKSKGAFTLAAGAVSVAAGSSTVETVTIAPTGGYGGLVNLTLSTNPVIANACYTLTSPTISATSAVPVPVTIYTNQNACPTGSLPLRQSSSARAATSAPAAPHSRLPAGLALAGLLALGFVGRRSRTLRGLVLMAVLAVAGFGLTGCGSNAPGTGVVISTTAPPGAYTVLVTGVDGATGTNTATTSFVLTIQ